MRQNSPKTDLIFDKSNTIIQCATIVFSIKGTGSIGYLEKEEKNYFDACAYPTQK